MKIDVGKKQILQQLIWRVNGKGTEKERKRNGKERKKESRSSVQKSNEAETAASILTKERAAGTRYSKMRNGQFFAT